MNPILCNPHVYNRNRVVEENREIDFLTLPVTLSHIICGIVYSYYPISEALRVYQGRRFKMTEHKLSGS